MNPTGRLAALHAKTGKEKWAIDLKTQFGARYGTWALAENILVDGDRVLCLPGGSEGFAVALNRKTGETVWVNEEFLDRVEGANILDDVFGSDHCPVGLEVEL